MRFKRNKMLAFLLSFMMLALNMFSGAGSMYAYAGTEADDQPAVELVTDSEQTDNEQTEDTSMTEDEEVAVTTTEGAGSSEEEADEVTPSESEEPEAVEETVPEETAANAEEEAVQEGKEAPFDQSKTVDGVKVRVAADAGVFPDGSILMVKKLSGAAKAEAKEAVAEKTDGEDIAKEYLFDITILDKDGNEIQPEGKANVSFETSEVADESLQAKVYHVKDNGKAEALDVEANGEVAEVQTAGFSAYSLIFTHADTSTGTIKSVNLPVGTEDEIGPYLTAIGLSEDNIANIESADQNIIKVYKEDDVWYFKALSADDNEHSLTIHYSNGHQTVVTVMSHEHSWTATGNETAKLTIKCDSDKCCYEKKEFTAEISASDATYDGNSHGATKTLSGQPNSFPESDVTVGALHYVGEEGTTYADSTTAPTGAGKYKAYYVVEPHGSTTKYTVQTTYTIKKADIEFDPAPAAASNLVYNAADQNLYTLGTAKSKTVSGTTFPIKYWYTNDSSQKFDNKVLTGKNAGTYKISYQSEGDANHNATEVKTLEITIAKRPVTVSGITASNKTYDGTTAATLSYTGAQFDNMMSGDTLTVSAKGTFENKNVGTDKIVNITEMKLGGKDADNYVLNETGQQGSAKANITQKTIKVHWQEPAKLEYTGAEQAPEATFDFGKELSPDDEKAYTGDDVKPVVAGKNAAVGQHRATVNGLEGEDAGNYKLEEGSSNVGLEYTIVRKKITVDWKTREKEYDAKGLEPEWSLTGFVEGEQPEKTLVLTADPTELVSDEAVNAGTYKATIELSGETASNYEITNPESPFTITKAPLTVYAKGWIYYGEEIDSNEDIHDLEYDKEKITGFKGEDGVGVLEGDVIFNTNYNFLKKATGVEGAKYYLIPQFEKAANYTVTNAEGELTVYPKPVKLVWTHEHDGTEEDVSGEQAFTYDGKEHKYTAKVSEDSYVKTPQGQQADPDMTVESYDGNVQKDANAKTGTDKYTAEAMTLSDPNYALTDKDGKAVETKAVDFTIAQLPIEFEWAPLSFTYNGKDQTIMAKISNLVKGDAHPLAYEGQTEKNAGDYTAKITEVVDLNYTIKAEDESKMEKNWTIKPLPVKLTWTNGNKV